MQSVSGSMPTPASTTMTESPCCDVGWLSHVRGRARCKRPLPNGRTLQACVQRHAPRCAKCVIWRGRSSESQLPAHASRCMTLCRIAPHGNGTAADWQHSASGWSPFDHRDPAICVTWRDRLVGQTVLASQWRRRSCERDRRCPDGPIRLLHRGSRDEALGRKSARELAQGLADCRGATHTEGQPALSLWSGAERPVRLLREAFGLSVVSSSRVALRVRGPLDNRLTAGQHLHHDRLSA